MLLERKHSWVIFVAIAKSLGLHLRSLVRALLGVNPTWGKSYFSLLFHLFKPCNFYPKKRVTTRRLPSLFFYKHGLIGDQLPAKSHDVV